LWKGVTEHDATVTVNGIPAQVNDDGAFSCVLSNLLEDVLTNIDVVAKDAAGNSTKRSVIVKYIKSIIMKLQISNRSVLINNEIDSLEAAPVIKDGRTMVPLRFVGEAFGAEFEYEPVNKTIDISFGSDKVKMQIGSKTAIVNGKEITLDVAPFIVNGKNTCASKIYFRSIWCRKFIWEWT